MDSVIANRWLASFFGPDRSAVAPGSWDVALFVGDPESGGVEQTGPGYARVTLSSAAFPAYADLVDGSTSAVVTFPPATGEWPDDCTHWALFGPTGRMGPSGELGVPVEVGAAGSFDPVQVTVFFVDIEEF